MEQIQQHPVKTSPNFADWIFILLVALAVYVVALLGHEAYKEGMKTEITKKNGEEFAAWMTAAAAKRFNADFEHAACAGGKPPVAAKAEPAALATANPGEEVSPATAEAAAPSPAPVAEAEAAPIPGTWGACIKYMMTQTAFKDMVNPFFDEPPQFIPACVPTDTSMTGMFVVEKMVPTPAGSAVPMVNSQLMETDPIDQKVQVRVSVCDKGSYAIKIAEFEF